MTLMTTNERRTPRQLPFSTEDMVQLEAIDEMLRHGATTMASQRLRALLDLLDSRDYLDKADPEART